MVYTSCTATPRICEGTGGDEARLADLPKQILNLYSSIQLFIMYDCLYQLYYGK